MFLKTYQKYLIKEFLFFILKVTFIFFILGFIMGILEELKFFSDIDVEFYFPIFLVFLTTGTIQYNFCFSSSIISTSGLWSAPIFLGDVALL